jgi:DNA-binding ferritin-like protein
VYGSVDPFAENIRKIKGRPLNLTEMVNTAMFADDSQASDAYELAADLFAKNTKVLSMLNALYEVAEEKYEHSIENFIAERIDAHMKWDWQLSASLAS